MSDVHVLAVRFRRFESDAYVLALALLAVSRQPSAVSRHGADGGGTLNTCARINSITDSVRPRLAHF